MLAYIITNTLSGLKYVGITTGSLQRRWKQHIRASETGRGCPALSEAIKEYGADVFTIEGIACAATHDDLMFLERLLVAQEGTLAPSGYNLTSGGGGLFSPSKETRERMSRDRKARCSTPEAIERMRAISSLAVRMKGRKMSEAFCLNQSRQRSGVRMPDGTGDKISAALRGREFTPEHRANLSAAKRGRWSAKQEAVLREVHKRQVGKKRPLLTEEARKRMSEAQKRRWARRGATAS